VFGEAIDVGLFDEIGGFIVGAEIGAEGGEGIRVFLGHDLESAGETVVAAVLGGNSFARTSDRTG
jgi:hypothetical protein